MVFNSEIPIDLKLVMCLKSYSNLTNNWFFGPPKGVPEGKILIIDMY